MKLTEEQKDAVLSIHGNIVAIASAGSGKTSSFTTRIAYMIEKGIRPHNILSITFTKKASEEMKKRLGKLIGKKRAELIPMGTFHSIAYQILRLMDSGFSKYKIAPDWWRFSLLNDFCKSATDKNPNGLDINLRASELASFISYQKNNMITPDKPVIIDDSISFVKGVPIEQLQSAYVNYERLKEQSRQIDFDDMMLRLYNKLISDKQFRNKLSDKYKYIMVDEFQDTSTIVLEIIKMINDKNVFVVGDFRQSVYRFINANVDNILNFKDEFQDAKLIELNKNFRSTQTIVDFSNEIISKSPIQKYNDYKPSESISGIGDKVNLTLYQDEYQQMEGVSRKIINENNNGTPMNEIAILVRTNAQTAIVEDKLANADIPYEVSKNRSFFDRKEILDILSYARLSIDDKDDASFRRIYNSPNRYLSKKFLNELEEFALTRDLSLYEAVQITPHNSEWKYRSNIEEITRVVSELKHQVDSNVNAGRILRNIVKETKYKKFINETSTSPSSLDEKIEAIDRLCEMGAKFPSIKAFLAHIVKIKDKQAKSKGKDAVQIITMHSSKGLEWDVCFVLNCNKKLMPHDMNGDIEEERRLFYVASSRPRKRLYISWFQYDSNLSIAYPSKFLIELLGSEELNNMKKKLFRGNGQVSVLYPLD
ncbi:ATP-dependent helicase [Virgibacillus sp. M23]|uniref:ATP-dependent helicase n=1 Tax=Virgibacillus sp. M23 TaxID=3079030 RepID=UPI002A910425|nr:ATP-dependent helicase [Virgibacillus sp. M23]MDY7043668.1 ATP-dependent helicase [Virgibacillus sp. M23]